MKNAPDIFQYDDYRRYLKDFYDFRKQEHATFSFRVFTRMAGYRSSSVLKLVIDGKRNLTRKSATRFAEALKFDDDQSKFFKILVAFNQSQSMEDKQRLAQEIVGSQIAKRLSPLSQSKFEYWSRWYHIAIREMISTQYFVNDTEWIAKHLIPRISVKEAHEAIECLIRLGIVEPTFDGKLRLTESAIATDDKIIHAFIANFHTAMLEKAKKAIQRFDRSERHISSITIALSEHSRQKALGLISKLHRELLALGNEAPPADRVFQMNFQVFPLTQRLS